MSKLALDLRLVPFVILMFAVPVLAQQKPCTDPAYRQFDFWLGKWEVVKPDGTVAGSNQIEKEYGGCVLHERYVTPKGYSGESLNTYDPSRKVWHQTWVDNTGLLLLLEGQFNGKSMILEAQLATPPVKRQSIVLVGRPMPIGVSGNFGSQQTPRVPGRWPLMDSISPPLPLSKF